PRATRFVEPASVTRTGTELSESHHGPQSVAVARLEEERTVPDPAPQAEQPARDALVADARAGLVVEGLAVELSDKTGVIVEDICFAVRPGEILALVGESGSGKTTIGMALLGYARPGARISTGSVVVDGTDILSLSKVDQRALLGARIAYMPQDPASAL